MQKAEQSCAELTAELLPDAEKELAAFAGAVRELFGTEHVRQSIEEWMEELERRKLPNEVRLSDWRRLTIAAASRLAIRLQHAASKNMAEFSTLICQAS